MNYIKMYSFRESNFVKEHTESFLKSTGLYYYDEKYIKSVDKSLTEIDFILNVNNYNICIMTKFIQPAPSSSTISKFILNLYKVAQITSLPVYGIILLKSDISDDSIFQLKTSGIQIQILQNNDKEILNKMFIEFLEFVVFNLNDQQIQETQATQETPNNPNNVYEIDSDGDTIMRGC